MPDRLPEVYAQLLHAARRIAEGSLRRLHELHDRYPADLPGGVFYPFPTQETPAPAANGAPAASGASRREP